MGVEEGPCNSQALHFTITVQIWDVMHCTMQYMHCMHLAVPPDFHQHLW